MDRMNLKTKTARQLINFIGAGLFPPGQRLPAERKLCEQLKVSRGTLRNGLVELCRLGIIEMRQGSGNYVCKPVGKSPAVITAQIMPPDYEKVSLEQIFYARKTIETGAVKLLCPNISKKQIDSLQAMLTNMQNVMGNVNEFVKIDMDFHRSMVSMSQNPVLLVAFDAISEYHKYSQVFTTELNRDQKLALKYHQRIVKALENRNLRHAVKVLNEHIDSVLGIINQRKAS